MLKQEDSFLPFCVSECPDGPWLVFAPHADDETYGMGGALLRASSRGIETHLTVLTDGALGGGSPELFSIREKEVQSVAKVLGICSLDCWRESDRGLQIQERLIDKILEKISSINPRAVFFPSLMEPHPDHRATSMLVWSALKKIPKTIRPAVYSYEISVQSPINVLIDITKYAKEKSEAMKLYASQNCENNYEEMVFSLDKARTFSLPEEVKQAEGFYCYEEEQINHSLSEVIREIVADYFT